MTTKQALGKVAITPKGAYAGSTTYERLDTVTYNGSSYMALQETTGNLPTNTTYWELLASKGDQGIQGIQGPKGDTGNPGASPLVASSTSEMTDTSRIYVNTTNGHWYWYDGDSWEDGGVYQASAGDKFLDNSSINATQNKTLYNALDEVLHIDNETKEITSVIDVTMTSGYMDLSGATYASDTYEYTNKINVKEGDVITTIPTTLSGSYHMRFITAFNGDTPVAASGAENVISYTVPSGIDGIRITCAPLSGISQIRKKYSEDVQNYISKNYNISDFDTYEYSLIPLEFTEGYMANNGVTDTNATLHYTQKISVQEGDVLYPFNNGSNTWRFRMLCAFKDGMAVPASGSNTDIDYYQVPSTINYTVVTLYKNTTNTYLLRKRPVTKVKEEYPNSNLGYMRWVGDIEINSVIKLDVSNVRYNTIINLTCDVTSFNKVSIGITAGDTFTEICSIDNTNLHYLSNATNYSNVAHGLTIANDLAISIQNNINLDRLNMLEDITIFSNGESFSTKANNINAHCKDFTEKVTLISDNSTLPNAKFSYIMKDIDKPIWLFGDSWLSIYTSRYIYYLIQNNQANNFMLNAYAGESSQSGLLALKDLIKIRQPKELIWCYGMNDGDQSHAVNTNWLSAIQDVIEICENNHIELILATIPSTATINNKEKNKIVRSLGYRYFDQVKAVTDSSGNWITGYVSTDGNHTSVAGAKALYYEILGDIPEIANF